MSPRFTRSRLSAPFNLTLLCWGVGTSSLGYADTPTTLDIAEPTVVTGSYAPTSSFELPFSIDTVDLSKGTDGQLGVNLSEVLSRVPGLVVQALVENAVRHGVAPREEGGRVSVKVVATPAAVRVTVMDDGPGLPASARATVRGDGPADAGTAGAGGGLRNTVERVRLTWPERARVEIGSTTGACLTLVLPYDEEAS